MIKFLKIETNAQNQTNEENERINHPTYGVKNEAKIYIKKKKKVKTIEKTKRWSFCRT